MGRAWGLEARAWPLDDSDVGPPTFFLLHIMTRPTRSRCENPPDPCLTPRPGCHSLFPALGPRRLCLTGYADADAPHWALTPVLPC